MISHFDDYDAEDAGDHDDDDDNKDFMYGYTPEYMYDSEDEADDN